MKSIKIRNAESKRVFDVNVDEDGEILDYELKNKKGMFKISGKEVKKQIKESLNNKKN